MLAKVWPDNPVHFPDFFNPLTEPWWRKYIKLWREQVCKCYLFPSVTCYCLMIDLQVQWDGVWIDMNEPSNKIDGSYEGCEVNKWNSPPYLPMMNSTEANILIEAIIFNSAVSSSSFKNPQGDMEFV